MDVQLRFHLLVPERSYYRPARWSTRGDIDEQPVQDIDGMENIPAPYIQSSTL